MQPQNNNQFCLSRVYSKIRIAFPGMSHELRSFMKKILFLTAFICLFAAMAFGQPRPVEKAPAKPAAKMPVPANVTAKYEGGMYGFSQKVTGTLKMDDANSRLVF